MGKITYTIVIPQDATEEDAAEYVKTISIKADAIQQEGLALNEDGSSRTIIEAFELFDVQTTVTTDSIDIVIE